MTVILNGFSFYDYMLSICLPYWSLSWNINELGIIIIIIPVLYHRWEQTNYHVQFFYKSQLYVIESLREEGLPCWKQSDYLSVEYFCVKC